MARDGLPVKVVIVDDDEIDRERLRRALRRAGSEIEAVEARDGTEAMSLLCGRLGGRPLDPPYVVVLDLNMPRMDGFEFLAALRDDPSLRHVAVFVLTTSNAPSDIARARDLGVAGYIVKSASARCTAALVTLLESYSRIVTLSP